MQRRNDGESLLDYLRRLGQGPGTEFDKVRAMEAELESADRLNGELTQQLEAAKRENGRLHKQITEGRAQNRRLLASVRTLREQRRRGELAEKAEHPIFVAARRPAAAFEADVERRLRANDEMIAWLERQVRELNAHLEESRSAIPAMDRAIAELRDIVAPQKAWDGHEGWQAP